MLHAEPSERVESLERVGSTSVTDWVRRRVMEGLGGGAEKPEDRFHLPEGCHFLPGYWGEEDIADLVRLLAEGSDPSEVNEVRPVSWEVFCAWGMDGAGRSSDERNRLVLVVDPLPAPKPQEAKDDSEDPGVFHPGRAARCVLLRRGEHDAETGEALEFVQTWLKPPIMTRLHLCLRNRAARVSEAQQALIAERVNEAASLSRDPFEVMRLLSLTWTEKEFRNALLRQGGRLLGEKLNRLSQEAAEAALKTIFLPDQTDPKREQSEQEWASQGLGSAGTGDSHMGSSASVGPLGGAVLTVPGCIGLCETMKKEACPAEVREAMPARLLEQVAEWMGKGLFAEAETQLLELLALSQTGEGGVPGVVQGGEALEFPATTRERFFAQTRCMQAMLWANQGRLEEASEMLQSQVIPVFDRLGDLGQRAMAMGCLGGILFMRGQADETLRICEEEQLPTYKKLGNAKACAATLGQIAGLREARGEWDEALRIRRQEELPLHEQLGDVRARAVTLGKMADVLEKRGEFDESLRIRKEEELPVYDRIGDAHSCALTWVKIADVLQTRGQVDEALRIYREQASPVFEQLGDIRFRAITQGKIAAILQRRGQFREALRIRREEELPVYEKLGDGRSVAITRANMASLLDTSRDSKEALRIYQEEVLPEFERLGDACSRAATLGKIADILHKEGATEEALRMFREEVLPVFAEFGENRLHTVALGQIADLLQSLGQFEEALRIQREEVLPAFEKLEDIRAHAVTHRKIAEILRAQKQNDEALRLLHEQVLPVFHKLKDTREHAMTLGLWADILATQNKKGEAIAIWEEQVLPALTGIQDDHGIHWAASALGRLYLRRGAQGDKARASQLFQRAREAAKDHPEIDSTILTSPIPQATPNRPQKQPKRH